MIIDCHTHLPVISSERNFEDSKKIMLEDMKNCGVDFAIVIPDNVHESKIGDLDVNLGIVEGEKNLFLLGTIDIEKDGEDWISKLDSLFGEGKIKGIKIFPGHDPIYPTDKRLVPVCELCVRYDYPLMIHTGQNSNDSDVARYNDPKYIVELAKKFPDLKIIISHYFWPRVEYCYEITRGFKNIYFDTSALADEEVIEASGLDKIKDVLCRSIRDNPESLLFGTDYAMCSFIDHIALIDSLDLTEIDKERVFWKNANKLFRLGL